LEFQDTSSGHLRVEHHVGIWTGGPPGRWDPKGRLGRWSDLIDLRTGAILLDASPFETSEFRWPKDGRLLFWMQNRSNQGMFAILPESREFSSLSAASPLRPLSELSDAVHAEYDRMILAQPPRLVDKYGAAPLRLERRFTPFGSVRLDLLVWRDGRDQEIESARVVLTATDEIILDTWPDWECRANLYRDDLFYLDLLDGDFKVTLNVRPDQGCARISSAKIGDEILPTLDDVPLNQVRTVIDERRQAAKAWDLAQSGY
jgi:hypothetical protein